MTPIRIAIATLLFGPLTACGVDGPPSRPAPAAPPTAGPAGPQSGVTLTGTAKVGVVGGSGGIRR
ncbi:MAG TPA: hypothetical protein DDY29_03490 [Rhodobacteraceae bacterium]|mgnify:CR=1 FL=1|jgi:predicted small lipoprotein YifL|nr:hypothetical protein [Paracoccaceae bacterium]HBG97811.1 hypothetical protein [Paracoccaceae bacterium]